MLRRIALTACLLLQAFGFAGCDRSPSGSTQEAAVASAVPSEEFLRLMNAGKNHLDQGDAAQALTVYRRAEAIAPNDADVHLNLANASLMAGAAQDAIHEAELVLQLSPNSAAAYFVKGSAFLRLSKAEDAVKALENARRIDPGEMATCFQLGKARMELKQWEEAITAFRDGLAMDPNHLHAAVHYLLGQSLIRVGRQDEAQEELQQHQAGLEADGSPATTETFERSRHTQARVPFRLEQPDPEPIRQQFVDATSEVLGEGAKEFAGPIGVIDVDRSGWNSLFVVEPRQGFRLLRNSGGTFQPSGPLYPTPMDGRFRTVLVGDLQNDRFEDVVVLGQQGCHVFRFSTNGLAEDVSAFSQLDGVTAMGGTLMDLDFTGKLDLVVVQAESGEVKVYRQSEPLRFNPITEASGIPASLRDAEAVLMEDWNGDGMGDLVIPRRTGPPLLLEKQRGGPLVPRELTGWVDGVVSCTGDFDNDLRPDLAVAAHGQVTVCLQGSKPTSLPIPGADRFFQILAFDHDNDGWLDLWGVGESLRVWRNTGIGGFVEQTAQLGLGGFGSGVLSAMHVADFDRDCDSDVILVQAAGGLRYLRNDGGNAHSQVKVQLIGNRSNASGLGCKIEIETGGLRLLRMVKHLPVEVGVGKHQKLDSFLVHWFNWPQGSADAPVDCQEPLLALEATLQEGSCPYLYAWDGERFRFVTDILGAAPLGLPVAEYRYVEADPEELVWVGDETSFRPRDGHYEVRITEELREVLYLDEAKLVVVDHPVGVEVHASDKLLPGGPFPPGEFVALHREQPLQWAATLDGQDVTASLICVDGQRVSPPRLRVPQLRGLAEPHGWVLDFGPLDVSRPLVLVMNGWLRFGGGMANIAASQDPTLPFPFPVLEAEIEPGRWERVDVVVGAPAGKTKTILVELDGKLKAGTRRLRLTGAFEVHWDRIALMDSLTGAGGRVAGRESGKNPSGDTPGSSAGVTPVATVGRFMRREMAGAQVTGVAPSEAKLRFRGFSQLQHLPPDCPLTPDYDIVSANSPWTILPEGWCTRYGEVSELLVQQDEGLALVHAGDELSLKFAVESLPPRPAGHVRQFFLCVDGWDKDSDFHVATGTQLEPLPFHGMNDQLYGREERPAFPSDVLHRKFNTRWVDGRSLRQAAVRSALSDGAVVGSSRE